MNPTSLIGRPLAALLRRAVGFAEKRGVWSGPLSLSSPEIARWLGMSTSTSTGMNVNESTAFTYSVFWACVNNISTDVASFPLMLYKRESDGAKTVLRDHKLYTILHDAPNPEMTSMSFRGVLTSHALSVGMGFAEIVRDGQGRVAQLWPITPDRVSVRRTSQGGLFYEVAREDGGINRLAPEQMFVLPGSSHDGVLGRNIVGMARESIGLGLAAERFGGTFFGNGSTFGGVLEHPSRLTDAAHKNLRESLNAQHQGVEKAHKFVILEENMKYVKVGVDPNAAQFLETRQHQIEEMCRWFRMPPHKVQHLIRTSYNSVEHMDIEYYSDTLRPWCVRWEQEILRQLISPLERRIQFAEHKIEGKLRGDLASRYAAYAVGRQNGWLSADDIRELENMNPLPNGQGKMYLVPSNMAPADRVNEIVDKQVEPTPAPVVAPPAEKKDDDEAERMIIAIRQTLTDVEARIVEHAGKAAAAEAQLATYVTGNENLEALVAEHRAEAEQAKGEAAELRAILLVAQERVDRLAAEKAEVERAKAAAELEAAAREDAIKRHAEAEKQRADAEAARRQADTERLTREAAEQEAALKAQVEAIARAKTEAELEAAAREDALRRQAEAAASVTEAQIAELRAALEDIGTAKADVEAKVAELQAGITTIEASLNEARQAKADAETRAIQTVETLQAKDQQHATLVQQWEAERQIMQQTSMVADGVIAKLQAQLEAAEATRVADAEARAALQQAAADAAADVIRLQAEKEAFDRIVAMLQAERDTLTTEKTQTAEQLAAAMVEREQARVDLANVTAEAAEKSQRLTEAEARSQASEAQAESVRASLQAAHQRSADQTQAVIAANRDLIASLMARSIWKETEGARKNRGTPAKLLAWADGNYTLQEDRTVDDLRPGMRVHLAFIGSSDDVDTYTRALVREQIAEAREQLRAVAAGDADVFPEALERLLTKWERERPAALANRILQEEVSYVRSR